MSGRTYGRLRKGTEFDSVYSKGSVVNGPFFVVRCYPNGLGRSRWGFAVGKKLLPRATARNRTRRRLRDAVAEVENLGSSDYIVTAKARSVEDPFAEIVDELRRSVERCRVARVSP
jgi:ribonuclease P protein component